MNDDELVIVCSCSALGHVVRFSRDDEGEQILSVALNLERSWWKRFKTAIAYLFKGDVCRYDFASEIIIDAKDVPRIRVWLDGGAK